MLHGTKANVICFPDGVTLDQELVYGAVDEYYMEKILPEPGTWVAVEVTTVLNPGHFYVSLPFGKSAIDNLKEKEGKKKKLIRKTPYHIVAHFCYLLV